MSSGGITITPGQTFGNTSEAVTLAKLNALGNPTARLEAGAVTSRELGSSIVPLDPVSKAYIYDDFIAKATANYEFATSTGAGGSASVFTGGGPYCFGAAALATGTSNSAYAIIGPSSTANQVAISTGLGAISFETRVYINTALPSGGDAVVAVSLNSAGVTLPSATTDAQLTLYYSDNVNSGKWRARTSDGATQTDVDTGVTVAGSTWYRLGIETNSAGTLATFYINGVSVGTSSTHLPGLTSDLGVQVGIKNSAGGTTNRGLIVDYIKLVQTFAADR